MQGRAPIFRSIFPVVFYELCWLVWCGIPRLDYYDSKYMKGSIIPYNHQSTGVSNTAHLVLEMMCNCLFSAVRMNRRILVASNQWWASFVAPFSYVASQGLEKKVGWIAQLAKRLPNHAWQANRAVGSFKKPVSDGDCHGDYTVVPLIFVGVSIRVPCLLGIFFTNHCRLQHSNGFYGSIGPLLNWTVFKTSVGWWLGGDYTTLQILGMIIITITKQTW